MRQELSSLALTMTTDAGARAVGSGVAAPADVAFVPCPLSHIPAPALDEYKQVFEDLDFDEDGLLFREFCVATDNRPRVRVRAAACACAAAIGPSTTPCAAEEVSAALRLNSVDITAAEMTVFLGAMSGGGQGEGVGVEGCCDCG